VSARRAAIAAALALLVGCAPVRLERAQLSTAAPAPPCAAAGAPRVWIAGIVDARPDTSSLGSIGARPVSSADVTAWIDGELAALASPGFTARAGGEPNAGDRLAVRTRILKAYVDGVNVTKTAVLVLGAELTAPDGAVTRRTYRGQTAGVNWWGSEGEAAAALREAAANCLEQLRADVETLLHPGQAAPPPCPVLDAT
jgi:hypothetical protein